MLSFCFFFGLSSAYLLHDREFPLCTLLPWEDTIHGISHNPYLLCIFSWEQIIKATTSHARINMCREKSSGEKYSVYVSKGMSENQRQPFRERRSGGYLKDVSGVSRFSAVAYRCVSEKYLSAHPVMDANPQSQHFLMLAVRSPRRFIFGGTEANNSAVITSGPSRPRT